MKVLRTAEVLTLLGITRSTLYRWETRPGFPSKIRLGPNAVGWLESEVIAWLKERRVGWGEESGR